MSGNPYLKIAANGVGFQEELGQQTSSGAAPGDLVALNSSSQIDASLLPSMPGGGITVDTTIFEMSDMTCQLTVGGTATPTDVLQITFTDTTTGNVILGQASENETYTVQISDTLGDIAAAFNTAINGDSVLTNAGISSTVLGTVLTIVMPSNFLVASNTSSGSPMETLVFQNSGVGAVYLTGSENNVLQFDIQNNLGVGGSDGSSKGDQFNVILPTSASYANKVYYFTLVNPTVFNTNFGNTANVKPSGTDTLSTGIYPPITTWNVLQGSDFGTIADGSSTWLPLTPEVMAELSPNTILQVSGSGQVVATQLALDNTSSFSSHLLPSLGGTGANNPGTSGHILVGDVNSYVDTALTSPDSSITVTAGAGSLTIEVDQANLSLSDIGGSLDLESQVGSSVLPTANGGTGADNTATDGHILIGKTSGNEYVDSQITSSGTTIIVTEGAGTLNIDVDQANLSLQDIGGQLSIFQNTSAITATAGGTNITAGALIYLDSSGLIQLADNSVPQIATGFAPAPITASTSGKVVMGDGPNVGVTGLTAGTQYLLGTAGGLTTVVPSGSGDAVQPVGVAISSTLLSVQLRLPTYRA